MSSDFMVCSNLNRLEWCTPLPVLNQPRESPVFLLNGNEWYFRFVVDICEGMWCGVVYMELKKRQTDLQSCSVKFQIGFKNEETLGLGDGRFTLSSEQCKVWNMNIAILLSKLNWGYFTGNWIKFIFEFERDDEPISILKFNKVTGE